MIATPAPTAAVTPASSFTAQASAASPTPRASSNPIGPALGKNDPCTSLSAIVTRPTVTNSVCTVRPSHVLIETGYQNTTFSNGSGNTVVYPQALIRIATRIPALEFDLSPPEVERNSQRNGETDVGAGLKYVLGYTARFNYGAQFFLTVPTGSDTFTAGASESTYAVNAEYTIGSAISLASTLSLSSLTEAGQRFASFVPSLVVSVSLPAATIPFAEITTFSHADGPASATRTQYLLGASHDFGARLQIDAAFGFSPTVATGTYRYIGAGLSYYL